MDLDDKDASCYVCGSENPLGLHVPFAPYGENGSRAFYTARPEHTGWRGILHGGLTFALMDEALGWALYYQGLRGVTAKTEVRFRSAVRVGAPLVITASTEGRARRVVRARAEVRSDDADNEVVAELSATMYLMTESRPPDAGGA
jgi:acyl-coenzyme A thioesterase PaaI-like protein